MSEPEELLVAAEPAESRRPFFAYGAICAVAASAAVVALLLGHPDPLSAVLVFLVPVAVVLAAVRATAWRLLPGRVRVTCGPGGVAFWRGTRLIRRRSWDGIDAVVLSPGDRWPEWNTAAGFASVELYSDGDPGVVSSPGILLVVPERLAEQEARLQAVVGRFIDNVWPVR